MENAQAAHACCNEAKGARVDRGEEKTQSADAEIRETDKRQVRAEIPDSELERDADDGADGDVEFGFFTL